MHKAERALAVLAAFLFLAPAGAPVYSAEARKLPRAVTIGTNPPGTVFYALAGGLAKVASEATPMQVNIQPYTGTSTFLPLLNGGELDFAIVNAVDMGMAYLGPHKLKVGGKNDFQHSPNVRLVMRGAPLIVGLLVKKDSPLKSVHDVKGKRVTGEYPAHQAVWFNMYGALASGGLSWNDVKVVPVPAVNDGIDALVQGRADVTVGALNMAKIREADAAVGVRHLSHDCSPEGEKRLRQAVPGYYPLLMKAGSAAAITEDTCTAAYDVYFATHKAAPDQVVGAILKAIWENEEKLKPIHPAFKEWTRDRAVSADVTIPYHPGAIKFYQEKGAWKKEMDQVQQKLLAQN
ncbi:MAG TPA: TAXI family TRAP transporter solute-binding subunit [Candidatus Acidoferrales bacterium]|nr:TAXI family TRAP transporter solute-binding subunit [Candidatus Acidoferrales bacterium]